MKFVTTVIRIPSLQMLPNTLAVIFIVLFFVSVTLLMQAIHLLTISPLSLKVSKLLYRILYRLASLDQRFIVSRR
ncbi:hypothetical protein [Neptuniibacter sp. 1_MG-2023]|uniref:hypothetical protein n=1 Tax=Neptuniibacter sp. 1_MG-2023 TaxID=3062662 RepID=UPI0026E195B8|nr:hypothetical protein [Neptuniibacter sp. 1_MG-2023]MDO6593816.1 hypothetical protein [Neptuniibacter sp. 1_MG-2023]